MQGQRNGRTHRVCLPLWGQNKPSPATIPNTWNDGGAAVVSSEFGGGIDRFWECHIINRECILYLAYDLFNYVITMESTATNACYAIFNNHWCHTTTTTESIIANGRYTTGNSHRNQATTMYSFRTICRWSVSYLPFCSPSNKVMLMELG